ncbi:MAG: DUF4160 domain-containing protein [Candidatus Rokuibacteriota bacterium]
MPEISRFLGIVVAMFYGDHPLPHFHVRYGDDRAIIDIDALQLLAGWLPPRVLGLAIEWGALHRHELLENWHRARRQEPLVPVAPLE